MKRGITGIDVVKALAESGYTELAESILNMLKQRVIGDICIRQLFWMNISR